MGEAVISATIQVLVGKLIAVAGEEIGLVFGVENELKLLKQSMETIQEFLDDASKRQVQQDKIVQRWLKNLEDVSYEADNLVDEFNYQILRHKVEISNQMKKPRKVCFCFSRFSNSNNLVSRLKMAHNIKDLNAKLKMINEEATSYGLQRRVANAAFALPPVLVETVSISVDPIVLGRDDDASRIIDILDVNPSSEKEEEEEVISVIPIVGMGGLGKTTLARLVFNDQCVEKHFSEKIWVCVSEDFNITRLLKRILEIVKGSGVQVESREAILKMLQETLRGKRYLLVLDDLWNENAMDWDGVKRCLLGINSNKRNFIVASIIAVDHPHYSLGKLSHEECWSIIKARAFPNNGKIPGEEFEAIGSEIAKHVVEVCRSPPTSSVEPYEGRESMIGPRFYKVDFHIPTTERL